MKPLLIALLALTACTPKHKPTASVTCSRGGKVVFSGSVAKARIVDRTLYYTDLRGRDHEIEADCVLMSFE